MSVAYRDAAGNAPTSSELVDQLFFGAKIDDDSLVETVVSDGDVLSFGCSPSLLLSCCSPSPSPCLTVPREIASGTPATLLYATQPTSRALPRPAWGRICSSRLPCSTTRYR
jgi:hypothetical protein